MKMWIILAHWSDGSGTPEIFGLFDNERTAKNVFDMVMASDPAMTVRIIPQEVFDSEP